MPTGQPVLLRYWRAFAYCLSLTRFSVLALLATLVLLLAGQGRDLLLSIAEDGRYLSFVLSTALWAFSIWLWARVLLDIRFPDPPSDREAYNFWRRHLPRALGAAAFAAVAVAALRTTAVTLTLAWLNAGAGIVFWLCLGYRRRLAKAIARRLSPADPAAHWLWVESIAPGDTPPFADLRQALRGVRGKLAVVAMSAGLALFAAGWAAPVALGSLLGALLLLMLWGATWLPFGTLLTYFGTRRGLPVLSILFVLALLFSNWNDNHEIPAVAAAPLPAARPSVDEALDAWRRANCRGEHCPPMVLIATAGGGSRAAYWTGSLLGRLQDRIPAFDESLFAVSGVSGGALGAAVYRALLGPGVRPPTACAGAMEDCTQAVLGRDFLAPVAARLLHTDLLQRFLPWPLLPDRGAALEAAWRQALREVSGTERSLSTALGDLNPPAGRSWPALFLNATWVDNGRRLVASNLRFDHQSGVPDAPFERANDQLAVLGYDPGLAAAAHNSARFPLISPPGMWRDGDGRVAGRLQDGGLFENYGAETALELLEAVCDRFTCARDELSFPSVERPRLTPIVVLISSDPALPANLAESPRHPPAGFAYELRSTLHSFANTRVGRGAEAAVRLAERVRPLGHFIEFRMCRPTDDGETPPLGWALSTAAQRTIRGYLGATACPGNAAAMIDLERWLRSGA
jgi:hypothetical protein